MDDAEVTKVDPAVRIRAARAATVLARAAKQSGVELPVTVEDAAEVFETAPALTLTTVVRTLNEGRHPAATSLIGSALGRLTENVDAKGLLEAATLIDNALVFGDVLDAAATRTSGVPFEEVLDRALTLHEGGETAAGHVDYLVAEDEGTREEAKAYVLASLLDWRNHGHQPQRPDTGLVEALVPYADRPEWVFQQSLERGAYDPADLIEVLAVGTSGAAEGFL